MTLKLNAKTKLDKVSPAMWLVANTRILKTLVKADTNFNVLQYLAYTEMIGESACRFTRNSVLLFDDEYRQRQAAAGFPWGADAPHRSTVLLRDRLQAAPGTTQQRRAQGQGQGAGQRAHAVRSSGRGTPMD